MLSGQHEDARSNGACSPTWLHITDGDELCSATVSVLVAGSLLECKHKPRLHETVRFTFVSNRNQTFDRVYTTAARRPESSACSRPWRKPAER